MTNKMVPAFPYEGGLYWLFSDRGTPSYQGSHGYYISLYGEQHNVITSRSVALSCLFDDVVLAPADARLPDYGSYLSGQDYYHPDLRISFSWKFNEWDKENEAIADMLLKKTDIEKTFNKHKALPTDPWQRFHFICRCLLQMRVASENNAVIVGDKSFAEIYNYILQHLPKTDFEQQGGTIWQLDEKVVNLFGLDFGTTDVDIFTKIRQTNEITQYASSFRGAISASASDGNLPFMLAQIANDAMNTEKISRYVAGGFETVGSIANIGGLIPFLGTVTTAVGITSDLSARTTRKIEDKNQWYLIGSKMKEIALKEFIARMATEAKSGSS